MHRLRLQRLDWRRPACPQAPGRPCPPRRGLSSQTIPHLETLTAKWQPYWDQLAPKWHTLRRTDQGPAYVLPMFPYPSGSLHLGHLRVYTISDVLARFKHMQGYRVLHPIGWDAFGLPAENAAIERGEHPGKWTQRNIDAMKTQMQAMGGRWDWDCELRTCDPDFYKHTQRIFLMLHRRGLAYQAESVVNYDPVDKTVLANEQVDANGCSWRSGAKVEKRMLKQWFLKIKAFQDPLLKDLDALAEAGKWPDKVLAMQKNWIGKSDGATLGFAIQSTTGNASFSPVQVFTTRADTLFGVQYIALSLGHPIVSHLAAQDESLRAFIQRAKDLPSDTKEGYRLPSVVARNPVAQLLNTTDAVLPVYVAPYVLDDYGSGAVMGVPGHDTRDHAFWRANEGAEPIRTVIAPKYGHPGTSLVPGDQDVPVTSRGFVAAEIEHFGGKSSQQAADMIVDTLQRIGEPAQRTTNWRLRDWLISRQRYWGAPIPIIHCSSCGPVAVPENDLPVKLPDLPDSFFRGRKGNPLAEDEHWKKTTCHKCGSAAQRETDTMDTFMDSSWYFFRFLDPKNTNALLDPGKANNGMPVDLYVGGVEHAILHLLYARFISKFLATTSTWPQGNLVNGEPFRKLITQGMVHGETFIDPQTGRFLRPDEIDVTDPATPMIKTNGVKPVVSYEKMSKSKYNGVDPSATIAKYGADVTRAHILFQAPVGDVLEWDEKKITGVQRWLTRVLRLSTGFWVPVTDAQSFRVPTDDDDTLLSLLKSLASRGLLKNIASSTAHDQTSEDLHAKLSSEEADLWTKTQEKISSITTSYAETHSLNTIVSDLMTLTNTIWDTPQRSHITPYLKWHATAQLVRMLAPIAPGVAEECWENLTTLGPLSRTNPPSPTPQTTPSELEKKLQTTRTRTVFATGFPTPDSASLQALNPTVTCVVQVNGKRKFETKIPCLPSELGAGLASGRARGGTQTQIAVRRFVVERILETEEGKKWIGKGGKIWDKMVCEEGNECDKEDGWKGLLPRGWQVMVVGTGKLCNFYAPKE